MKRAHKPRFARKCMSAPAGTAAVRWNAAWPHTIARPNHVRAKSCPKLVGGEVHWSSSSQMFDRAGYWPARLSIHPFVYCFGAYRSQEDNGHLCDRTRYTCDYPLNSSSILPSAAPFRAETHSYENKEDNCASSPKRVLTRPQS